MAVYINDVGRKEMIVTCYCPACSEYFIAEIEDFYLAPGEQEITCTSCETTFTVKIEFYEKETE